MLPSVVMKEKRSIKINWEDQEPQLSGYHVYRLVHPETGQFYIGQHMGAVFGSYKGSGIWPATMRRAGIKLIKELVSLHENRDELLKAEKQAIIDNMHNSLCMNRLIKMGAIERELLAQRRADTNRAARSIKITQ